MFSRSDHHHGCPPQLPTSPSITSTPETQPIPCPDRVLAHYHRLETLLESALATLALIQDADYPITYTSHALEVLEAVNRRVTAATMSPLPSPHSAPTPASSSSSSSASTPVPLTTTGTKTYARATAARPSGPPLPSSDQARPDVVIRLDSSPEAYLGYPPALLHAIRKATPGTKLIAGVRWTRNGNLIIQVDPNTASASTLIETHQESIWRAIKPILRLPDTHPPPVFELAEPWHSVVFHNLPASGRSCYTLPLVQESLRVGGFDNVVKAIALLCSDEELRRRIDGGIPVSMRVSVPTAAAAQQLIDTGGSIIGGRYQATHYIPKPRTSVQDMNSTTFATVDSAD
jgi:hypothetical protein